MISSKGFTFIELLTVLAIIAIIASVSAPSFSNVIANNRLASTSNNILSTLQMARSEAVTQRTAVKVCATNAGGTACGNSTNWSAGVLIMRGTTVLRVVPTDNPSVTVQSSANEVVYQGNGTSAATTISVNDSRGGTARTIKVNVVGQACGGSSCS
ncbi:MAG: GspH/FimT family pseudopilin [Pseudomonas sp.]|uniref:GspH/FimT family pseudopilin n=1 Tax=Pseudomonas sp. TaxID=306 RepID=UPI0030F1AC7C